MEREPTKEQKAVIEELERNVVLYASAGTGKTFTIARRVAEIIRRGLAFPEEILLVTFTVKACREMREDVGALIGETSENLTISTVHGFCLKLLTEEGRLENKDFIDPVVFDEVDQEELLRDILSSYADKWVRRDALKKAGISLTDEEFYSLPVRKRRGGVWRLLKKGVWIHHSGVIEESEEEGEIVAGSCPYCKREQNFVTPVCSFCRERVRIDGLDTPRNFAVFRGKSVLRNFVSELKHEREARGFYSDNRENDYAFSYESCVRRGGARLSYRAYGESRFDEAAEEIMRAHAGEFVCEYEKRLEEGNRVDFDDVILRANAYLKNDEVRARRQSLYKYIFVDEMQDTSLLEYDVLKKLFKTANVMFCGDLFQTVYGWRGSMPEKILADFTETYGAVSKTFTENYRSTKLLTEAGHAFLKNVFPRTAGKSLPEKIEAKNEEDGEKIVCRAYGSRAEEAIAVYRYARKALKKGEESICVVVRSNGYADGLKREFDKISLELPKEERVRFFTIEGDKSFFKRAVIKDLLALVRIALDPNDTASLERLAEKYVKRVGAKTSEFLRTKPFGVDATSFLKKGTYERHDPYDVLVRAWEEGRVFVYDTETTGLDVNADQPVQISAVRFGKDGVTDSLDLFVLPTIPISLQAEKTHGFTREELIRRGAISQKEALKKFATFVEGGVLVGHNSDRFDFPLLKKRFFDEGLSFPNVEETFDTMILARMFHGELVDYKLSTLCERFAVVNECAHNAFGDIEATAKCLSRIVEEDILPSSDQRRKICEKYAATFEKFYAFYDEAKKKIFKNENEGFVSWASERLALRNRYSTAEDALALRETEALFSEATKPFASFLRTFSEEASIIGGKTDALFGRKNAVPIVTVHQSKGCEFDVVFLSGADGKNFPNAQAVSCGQEDEEKRVFYVAMTRAKKKLVLTRVRGNGATPYVKEIPAAFLDAEGFEEDEWNRA